MSDKECGIPVYDDRGVPPDGERARTLAGWHTPGLLGVPANDVDLTAWLEWLPLMYGRTSELPPEPEDALHGWRWSVTLLRWFCAVEGAYNMDIVALARMAAGGAQQSQTGDRACTLYDEAHQKEILHEVGAALARDRERENRAPALLQEALGAIGDRASQRDAPSGERSMGRTVAAFNAIFGHELTEEQGWQFMALLKIVRGSQGEVRADDYVDEAAYAALAGEAALRDRGTKVSDH